MSLLSFKYNFYTLSFTLMAKLIRRRRKHRTTKTPRNKITTPKALDIPLLRTPGGYLQAPGERGPGRQPLAQSTGAAAPVRPQNTGRAEFPQTCQDSTRPAACCVWSRLSPVSWIFWFVDLMPWADKIFSLRSMATWQAFNHPLNGDLGSSSSLHTMDLGSNKQSFISRILY